MCSFSFIIVSNVNFHSTINLLNSLSKQEFPIDHEIICVDQVKNQELCTTAKRIGCKYVSVDSNSLSKCRNLAIKMVNNKYIVLLDDDASLITNYFKNLHKTTCKYSEYDIIGSKILCNDNNQTYSKRHNNELKKVNKFNFELILSSGLIIKSNLFHKTGFFDEEFGVGSKWPACEESDFILRALKLNYKVLYDPENITKHPSIDVITFKVMRKKLYLYGIGRGALVKKHFLTLNLLSIYQIFLFPIVMFIINLTFLNFKKSYLYILSLMGRIYGFIKY